MSSSTVVQIGNAEITMQVVSIRKHRTSTVKDRIEVGRMFHDLRGAVTKYTRTSEDKKKVSYSEVVRLTGYHRSTAELYRQMFEICDGNDISPDVFVILADAGFNLARDLSEDVTASAVFTDNANLKSEEYLLGLSEDETKKLVKGLLKNYGKPEDEPVGIATLKSEIANYKAEAAKSTKPEYQAFCKEEATARTKTMHSKMISGLRSLSGALSVLLDKPANFAEAYIAETEENGALTEQRFREAVAFANKATFFPLTAKAKK
jgi:hypothetical protein